MRNPFVYYPFVSPSLMIGLVSFWDGSAVTDQMGRNDLTNSGVTFAATGGKPQGVATFLDTTYMTRTDANTSGLHFGLGSFSIACWIEEGGALSTRRMYGKGASADNVAGFLLQGVDSTGLVFKATVGDGTARYTAQATSHPSGLTFVVMVANRITNTLKIYHNGTQEASTDITACGTFTNTADFFIGASGAGAGLVGGLAGVGIWNRILSAGDVTALYAAGAGLNFRFTI